MGNAHQQPPRARDRDRDEPAIRAWELEREIHGLVIARIARVAHSNASVSHTTTPERQETTRAGIVALTLTVRPAGIAVPALIVLKATAEPCAA